MQFLFHDLKDIKNVYKSDPLKKKKQMKEFMLKLWRNFLNQLEILGLWDLAVSLIPLIQIGRL